MKCNHIVELFDSYLKGTATLEERSALEQHIATCETCRKQLELYRIFFADVNIENDFPIPPQLDAKIKYAVYQAKAAKKIPFWQNKRILSAATACAFLFVVGVFGASHYGKMKEAVQAPDPGLMQMADFHEEDVNEDLIATPEMTNGFSQIPTEEQILEDATESKKPLTEETNKAKPQKEEKVSPKATEKPKSSSKVVNESKPKATPKSSDTPKASNANTATKAAPDANTTVVASESADTPKTISEKPSDSSVAAEPNSKQAAHATLQPTPQPTQQPENTTAYTARGIMQENAESNKNVVIADQWKEPILANFPHEVIAKDTYLVTITKTELETVLGCSTSADESQSQLTLQFVSITE